MNALNLQGPARTKVHIVNDKGLTLEIPPDSILQGGFAHAFNGDGDAKYSIVVFYDTRPPYSIGIPNFRVEVTNTRTGKVLKTLKSQAPPRDEPLQLPPIENDETVPIITAGPVQTNSFDPSGLLQFTFSEAMDPASVKQNFTVLDKDGAAGRGRGPDLRRQPRRHVRAALRAARWRDVHRPCSPAAKARLASRRRAACRIAAATRSRRCASRSRRSRRPWSAATPVPHR